MTLLFSGGRQSSTTCPHDCCSSAWNQHANGWIVLLEFHTLMIFCWQLVIGMKEGFRSTKNWLTSIVSVNALSQFILILETLSKIFLGLDGSIKTVKLQIGKHSPSATTDWTLHQEGFFKWNLTSTSLSIHRHDLQNWWRHESAEQRSWQKLEIWIIQELQISKVVLTVEF